MTTAQAPIVERFALWRARIAAWWGRSTGFGLWLRLTIAGTGCAAMLLAAPDDMRWTFGALLAVPLSLMSMARPGGGWPSAVMLVTLAGWFAASVAAQFPSIAMAALLGGLLYLHHTAAALAAECRVDAAVDPRVRSRWLRRTGSVMAGSLAVAAGVAGLGANPIPVPGAVLLVAGLLLGLGISAALVFLLYRR